MATTARKIDTQPARFRVGELVGFPFGSAYVIGTVVEDRGKIGVGGRRLLRIEAPFAEDTLVTEMPEEDLQAV